MNYRRHVSFVGSILLALACLSTQLLSLFDLPNDNHDTNGGDHAFVPTNVNHPNHLHTNHNIMTTRNVWNRAVSNTTTTTTNTSTTTNTTTTTNTKTTTVGFAACLLIKDDNHYLIEWLAYHYYRLPLKRLIVAVDPTSKTSPSDILQRYQTRNLIHITQWSDSDFIPLRQQLQWQAQDMRHDYTNTHTNTHSNTNPGTTTTSTTNTTTTISPMAQAQRHIDRQHNFYLQCIKTLHQQHWTSWTAFIDVDEYIHPNPHFIHPFLPINKTWSSTTTTIYQLLEQHAQAKKYNSIKPNTIESSSSSSSSSSSISSPCIHMKRLLFGNQESPTSKIQYMAPNGMEELVHHLYTFRWRWHERYTDTILAKCLLDVSHIPTIDDDLVVSEINSHRIIKRYCSKSTMYIPYNQSFLLVYHYLGTWDQWSFRDDPRKRIGWARTKDLYQLRGNVHFASDDTIRPWLQGLIQQEGYDLVQILLDGAGQVENEDKETEKEIDHRSFSFQFRQPVVEIGHVVAHSVSIT